MRLKINTVVEHRKFTEYFDFFVEEHKQSPKKTLKKFYSN